MTGKYVCKSRTGKSSPKFCNQFKIDVRRNNRRDRPNTVVFRFRNYADIIGTKSYCAYRITPSKIYFKFSDIAEDDEHWFKMYVRGKQSKDLAGISDLGKDKEIYAHNSDFSILSRYVNMISYPVYYLGSSDEYVIQLADTKKKSLI